MSSSLPETASRTLSRRTRAAVFSDLCLLGIAILAVSLRAAKAHRGGVIFDEAFSYYYYSRSPEAALTTYFNPNNHVINSLLMWLSEQTCGWYEHHIRVPSVLASLVLLAALGYIVRRTLKSGTLRIVTFSLLSMHYFVFDLSILARGYAYGLAAFFAGAAFVLRSQNAGWGARRAWWGTVISISVVNFLTLGSMLSMAPQLAALTLVCLVPLGLRERNLADGLWTALRAFVVIVVITCALVAGLYSHIWRDVVEGSQLFEVEPISDYLHAWLFELFFENARGLGTVVPISFGVLTAAAVWSCSRRMWRYFGRGGSLLGLLDSHFDSGVLLALTGLAIVLTFLQWAVGVPLGYPRNTVVLSALGMLSSCVLLDVLWQGLPQRRRDRVLRGAIAASVAMVCWQNRPSTLAFRISDWSIQSFSGPLVRSLAMQSPDTFWTLDIRADAIFLRGCLLGYYAHHGYRLRLAERGSAMLTVTCDEDPRTAPPFGCVAIANRSPTAIVAPTRSGFEPRASCVSMEPGIPPMCSPGSGATSRL